MSNIQFIQVSNKYRNFYITAPFRSGETQVHVEDVFTQKYPDDVFVCACVVKQSDRSR
jgi:hypothetical protein